MKFSNKLSFVILITGMVILILSSLTVYKFSYDSMIKSEFIHTKYTADKVSDDIDQLLSEKVKTAMTLANTPIIKNALETSILTYANLSDEKRKESIKLLNAKWKSTKDPTDSFILKFTDNKVSRFLKEQQTILKGEYGEIFLTNKFGALVASTAKLSTFAHGHKYWWLGSYNDGEGAVFFDDRGYDDSVGGYVLGLVVPIRKGSEIIGILKCNLNILGNISELISDAKDKSVGKFKLTRSGGMVVFEEGFEPLSTQVHRSIFQKLKSRNDESFIINDSGGKYLVGFSEIKLTKAEKGYGFGGTFESIDHKKGNTGESWYVLCYRQMSVIQAPIKESIKWVVWIGIITILILVLVSQLLSRKMSQPIAILDIATKKVGKGDFEYRIDIRQKDEFGNLANSFNNMASELQQTTTSIERLENEANDRRQAEGALRESEEKYRNIFENIQDVYYEASMDGTIVEVSPSIENVSEYKRKELIGKSLYDIYTNPEERDELLKTLLDSGKIANYEIHLTDKDGSQYIVELNTMLQRDQKGNPVKLIGSMRDISERKQLEDRLRQSQKMEAIGSLAGGIAHQFNNALYVITGNIDFLETDYPEDEKIADYTMQIKDSAHRMAQLTNQLLAYAKGGKYQAKAMSVNDFVDNTLSNIHHVINPDIEIKTDLATGILNVKADQTQMQMMLAAILTNASEAIEGDGFIRITTKVEEIDAEFAKHHSEIKAGPYACLIVEDNGKGMDNETRNRIFEPFFSTKFEGRGLGMASAFGIVRNHDGLISVYSEAGRGTAVSVYLPLMETQTEAPLKSKIEPIKGSGTILIIEDEEMIMDVSQALLERLGYKVLGAMTGKDAVHTALTYDGEIDLAILDMVLPDMDGKAIYPLIMEARPDLKVLVCSGYSIDGPAREVINAGAQDFIQKPCTMADLSEKLKEILEGKQSSSN